MNSKIMKLTIVMLFFVSLAYGTTPFNSENINAEKADEKTRGVALGKKQATIKPAKSLIKLRAAGYNIAYARGEKPEKHTAIGKPTVLRNIAKLIKEKEIDIIGLTEISKGDARVLFKDQPKTIATYLNFNHVTSIGFKSGLGLLATRGNAIVSRFPILSHKNHELYRNDDKHERRGCLEATLDLGDAGKLTYLVTHLSLNKDEVEKQIDEIIKIVQDSKYPVILCGDFNSRPTSDRIKKLSKTMRDASSNLNNTYRNKPDIKIDYLFTQGAWVFGVCEKTGDNLSDHAMIFNDFWLLKKTK